MRIIEIAALSNGAHRNQAGGVTTLPEGWAIIPDEMELPSSFPFVELEIGTAEYPGGIDEEPISLPTVIAMTEGTMPPPLPSTESEPQSEDDSSVWDELDAAYREGVNDV